MGTQVLIMLFHGEKSFQSLASVLAIPIKQVTCVFSPLPPCTTLQVLSIGLILATPPQLSSILAVEIY